VALFARWQTQRREACCIRRAYWTGPDRRLFLSHKVIKPKRIQGEAQMAIVYHPKPDDAGRPVVLRNPSKPTPPMTWEDPCSVASVIPGGNMPAKINGIPFAEWSGAPESPTAWNEVAGQADIDEPPFHCPKGKAEAAGVVVCEPDGRVWLVAPSNGYAGYQATFPKGRVEKGISRQANAIREAFEEAGLQVSITAFLADSNRSLTYTRYYLACRVGGTPAAMGWESQAVHLVPRDKLSHFLNHTNDQPLIKVLENVCVNLGEQPNPAPTIGGQLARADILRTDWLTSAARIVATVAGFRATFGSWPTHIEMPVLMAEAIEEQVLTPLGWSLLMRKLHVVHGREGTVVATDGANRAFEYISADATSSPGIAADVWLWGVVLV
jgi:8-oxo-dGTP pyrophosphatase MutT (NUDIX family)